MNRPRQNQIIMLASRPSGLPALSNFLEKHTELPDLRDGEVLLRTRYLSLDPYMRGRMDDSPSYAPSIGLGDPMVGEAVSAVIESRNTAFPVGSLVLGSTGWQLHPVSNGSGLILLPRNIENPSFALSLLGMPGFTAWYGLLKIAKPHNGETLVVSAATGAVGSVVGQLAKLHGCRVVGIASSPEKCRYAVEALGFNACVDRNSTTFDRDLAEACPDGIDIDFENVGGSVLQSIWTLLNVRARITICGLISQYDGIPHATGPDRLASALNDVLLRRYIVEGFIILDHYATHFDEFLDAMNSLIREGKMIFKEDVRHGLGNAPAAFLDMLAGKNFGKVLVKVSEEAR